MSRQLRNPWSAAHRKLFGYDVRSVSAMTVKKVFPRRFAAKWVRYTRLMHFFVVRNASVGNSPVRVNRAVHLDCWRWVNLLEGTSGYNYTRLNFDMLSRVQVNLHGEQGLIQTKATVLHYTTLHYTTHTSAGERKQKFQMCHFLAWNCHFYWYFFCLQLQEQWMKTKHLLWGCGAKC